MMSAREIRAHLCEVRAAPEGDGLRFSGYAAKFDRWSEDLGGFRERIAPGAFSEAVAADDVRCLLNHNPDRVLGRTRSGTLRLFEDNVGLRFEVDAPDVGWARDLRESVWRGDIDQCSFAFEALADDWIWADSGSKALDERTVRRAKLYDVSIVTYPAYTDTVASVRSARAVHDGARAAAKARADGESGGNAGTLEGREPASEGRGKRNNMRRRLALKEKER